MTWQMLHENQFTIDPTHTKKVILSIDGGGMRGAIPIAMLAELEKQTNKRCQDMFHMVAGTSTGTIIAVGLALGMSAQQILDEVYVTRLPAAFAAGEPFIFWRLLGAVAAFVLKVDRDLASRIIANRLRYARKLSPFLKTLGDLSDGRYVGTLDPKNPILFATTKDMLTGETNFIVNAGKGKDKFKDWPLIAVVAASGAAPIFFEPVENRYVDGGVGVYANPCLAASIEAMEYICPEIPEFHDGNVIHISLGTGYVPELVKVSRVKKYRVLDWLQYIGLKGIDDAAIQQVFSTRGIYGLTGRMDFRRYNPLLEKDSLVNNLDMKLQKKQNPAKLGLDSFTSDKVALMVEIGREYAKRIDWSKPNVLPWETKGGQQDPKKIGELIPKIDWHHTRFAPKAGSNHN